MYHGEPVHIIKPLLSALICKLPNPSIKIPTPKKTQTSKKTSPRFVAAFDIAFSCQRFPMPSIIAVVIWLLLLSLYFQNKIASAAGGFQTI